MIFYYCLPKRLFWSRFLSRLHLYKSALFQLSLLLSLTVDRYVRKKSSNIRFIWSHCVGGSHHIKMFNAPNRESSSRDLQIRVPLHNEYLLEKDGRSLSIKEMTTRRQMKVAKGLRIQQHTGQDK